MAQADSCGRSAQTSGGRGGAGGWLRRWRRCPGSSVRRNGRCERSSARERWTRAAGALLRRSAHPASWPASMAVKS
eukprot:1276902-Prymnesium_polylepis.1